MAGRHETRRARVALLALGAWCAAAGTAVAKDLYVSPGGSDGVSYSANSVSSPWLTVEKAWYGAQPGDVVLFRAGTYAIVTGVNTTRANGYEGTAASPITFKPYPGESATIVGKAGVVMFELGKNWNVVQGLTFVGNGSPQIFRVGYDDPVDGFVAEDCTLSGYASGDNTGAFYLGSSGASPDAKNMVIRRCRITGPGTYPTVYQNTFGISIFGGRGIKLLNNEISMTAVAIIYKHNDSTAPLQDFGNEIAYNFITNSTRGSIWNTGRFVNIHDNVIGVNCGGILIGEAAGYAGGDYNTIAHNTVYGAAVLDLSYDPQNEDPSLYGAVHNTVRDNVFMARVSYHRYSAVPHATISDYNLFASPAVIENRVDYSLAAWRTRSGGDLHSVAGTPLFVGGTAPASPGGYALAAGSPGKSAASDGKDMGADLSLVGVAGGAPPQGLSTPQNMRVVVP